MNTDSSDSGTAKHAKTRREWYESGVVEGLKRRHAVARMCRRAETGIDDFQAGRSPDKRYRTTPLGGLFTRTKGGFYHDGRFADLNAVVDHYNQVFGLNLTSSEESDLVHYLKSL